LQPFQDKFPVNPSFEIAKLLPEVLLPTATHPRAIRIIAYPHAVRVAYQEVRELVPALLDTYGGVVDLILHIGMASGRSFYAAERLGHRDGYDKNADLDGVKLDPADGKKYFGDCPEALMTSLDFEEIMQGWVRNIHEASGSPLSIDARASNDAGHYLCDFIYYNSLAWYARRNKRSVDGMVDDRPVMFFHVPAESDPDTLERGRVALIALIRSMAESYAVSKSYQQHFDGMGH